MPHHLFALTRSSYAYRSAAVVWLAVSAVLGPAVDQAASEPQPPPIEDRSAFLRYVANTNESNFRNIRTWEGTYHHFLSHDMRIQILPDLETLGPSPDPELFNQFLSVHSDRRGTLRFAIDNQRDLSFTEFLADVSRSRLYDTQGEESCLG